MRCVHFPQIVHHQTSFLKCLRWDNIFYFYFHDIMERLHQVFPLCKNLDSIIPLFFLFFLFLFYLLFLSCFLSSNTLLANLLWNSSIWYSFSFITFLYFYVFKVFYSHFPRYNFQNLFLVAFELVTHDFPNHFHTKYLTILKLFCDHVDCANVL